MPSAARGGTRAGDQPVLSARHLIVEVAGSRARVVDGVSLDVAPGEIVGLAGESGCGKTTFSLALMGYCRRGLTITGGSISIAGQEILEMEQARRERAWGSLISYVPQDPVTALNPAIRLGRQLDEILRIHGFDGDAAARRQRISESLEEVKLPTGKELLRAYPHQLSGGQQQRIGIAMAILNRPKVIVMDEPTTGLDVTTQDHVLNTVREIVSEHGSGVVYVTHDLAVVSSLSDRIAVMYAGRMAEVGPVDEVLGSPSHPYVVGLMDAVPDLTRRGGLRGIPGHAPDPGRSPAACLYADRCPLAIDVCRTEQPPPVSTSPDHSAWCFRVHEAKASRSSAPAAVAAASSLDTVLKLVGLTANYGNKTVLSDLNLEVSRGRTVALVGESGSGKTTLARCVAGLHPSFSGSIELDGDVLTPAARGRTAHQRQTIQYIFQNPYASLNPRRTIEESVAQPLVHAADGLSRSERAERVSAVLEKVSLSATVRGRYPHQLSGGQRQRVAIARALVVDPQLLICDEITSALDVSVQAVIVELLQQLRHDSGLSMLFVTHNLALIPSIADDVAVMADGLIVERGAVSSVIAAPQAQATRTLVEHIPKLSPVALSH